MDPLFIFFVITIPNFYSLHCFQLFINIFFLSRYIEASRAIFDTLSFIVEAIRKIPELEVMGDPKVCIGKYHVFHVYK